MAVPRPSSVDVASGIDPRPTRTPPCPDGCAPPRCGLLRAPGVTASGDHPTNFARRVADVVTDGRAMAWGAGFDMAFQVLSTNRSVLNGVQAERGRVAVCAGLVAGGSVVAGESGSIWPPGTGPADLGPGKCWLGYRTFRQPRGRAARSLNAAAALITALMASGLLISIAELVRQIVG